MRTGGNAWRGCTPPHPASRQHATQKKPKIGPQRPSRQRGQLSIYKHMTHPQPLVTATVPVLASLHIAESAAAGRSLIAYDPRSAGANAYRAVAKEFLIPNFPPPVPGRGDWLRRRP